MAATQADRPTCRILIVGAGDVGRTVERFAVDLGWEPAVVEDRSTAEAIARELTVSDAVFVPSHDDEVNGPALVAALGSAAGYVGAMGSRRTQERRTSWLRDNGVLDDQLENIRAPAGLDIGAETSAEIAVAVVAEIIALRSGAPAGFLRDRPGPIHPVGPSEPRECPSD